MSKTQDFIFAFVERNYERQEEGGRQVLQSLPFFATSLGALLAGIGIIGTHVGDLHGSWALAARILLGLVLLLALVTIGCIGVALLGPYNTSETGGVRALILRARQLDEGYSGGALAPDQIDDRVLLELKAGLTEQMAFVGEYNQIINLRRLAWQKRAFAALIASLFFGFVTLFGVLVAGDQRADHEPIETRLNLRTDRGTGRDFEAAQRHNADAVARAASDRP